MNLLPRTEKENLKKGLKLRFIVLTASLLSVFFLVGFVMLLPSYFLVFGYFSKAVSENYLLESKDSDSVKKILSLPAEINAKLNFFQSNNNAVLVKDYFSEIISYLPEGVRLDSMLFSENQDSKGKKGSTILISGMAADRDSLVSFLSVLKKSTSFSTVEMPVSSLTKDKNLPFSMDIFVEN